MKNLHLLLGILFLSFQFSFSQLKSPQEFLGYEIGSQYTRHADVVKYFEYMAANSDLVEYHTYGKTNENRPLTYAVISIADNLKNLEEIRTNHLKSSGVMEGSVGSTPEKAIVWLSYNVHGNEASSTEAAMKTLYELVTNKQEWLQNTVVIMDPCVNPDGRDRYVNWYNQAKTDPYTTSPLTAGHHEPWPGGRANHYLFDLNRDWAWATQVETRQRLKLYNKWLPEVHVDFHEQGIDEPYYFAPGAEPLHEIITPFQKEFQTTIGKNHAKYFDKNGWLYFTKERFDLLYPSYGDTYPIYMGAIGMTYEQGGGGSSGLGINTHEGYVLTLKDRVEHHYTTGLSTIEVASQNVDKLNTNFNKFYHNSNNDFKYKSYVLKGNPDKIAALEDLLDIHNIKYSQASSGTVKGFNYTEDKNDNLNTNANSIVVSTTQPKGKMVKVLFEPSTVLHDSLTYDITAWSLPYVYGLDAVASNKEISGSTVAPKENIVNTVKSEGVGYIAKWNSMKDAQFLAALLKEGIKVRFTDVPVENAGGKFNTGSLIITKSDNQDIKNYDQKVVDIADQFGRKLNDAASGFSKSGPDFGSSEMKIINKPRVAVVKGEGTSSLSFGEVWHFFEKELNYPVIPINTNYLSRIDLNELDILILPDGRYGDVLDSSELDKLKDWVRSGGKIIAIEGALHSLAGKEGFGLQENNSVSADTLPKDNLKPYNMRERESIKNLITGSIVKTYVDNTHPMAFGYGDTYYSLKLSDDSYSYLDKGYNIAYLKENPEIVDGFAGSKAKKKIKNSLIFGEEPLGRGSIIYMVDNPLFRSFWQNGKLFFVNALFFVNNDNYRM